MDAGSYAKDIIQVEASYFTFEPTEVLIITTKYVRLSHEIK